MKKTSPKSKQPAGITALQLPNAGEPEWQIVERLTQIAESKLSADARLIELALEKWHAILPMDSQSPGYCYTRKQLSRKECERLTRCREEAARAQASDEQWFYELMLAGLPVPVTNFQIWCLYLVKTPDGNLIRRVILTNVLGETYGPVNLTAKDLHTPRNFRRWCFAHGNLVWHGGTIELSRLNSDLCQSAAGRVVNTVTTLGWFPLGECQINGRGPCDGLWFFGDGVWANSYDPDRNAVDDYWLPQDEHGICWYRRQLAHGEIIQEGYLLAEQSRERYFYQGLPMIHPQTDQTGSGLNVLEDSRQCDASLNGALPVAAHAPTGRTEQSGFEGEVDTGLAPNVAVRDFFREFSRRVRLAVGNLEAYSLIGCFLSYAAAPEIFAQYGRFPGGWVHGPNSDELCEFLMALWGFEPESGLRLRGDTASASNRQTGSVLWQAVDQYSNLPVWGAGYRNQDVNEYVKSLLYSGLHRARQVKFGQAALSREVRTNFIISGESASDERSFHSQYLHIQTGTNRRQGTQAEQRENVQWLQANCPNFHVIGRHVLEQRRKFVERVQDFLTDWSRTEIDPRSNLVNGVGAASWLALAEMLGSHTADELAAFKRHHEAKRKQKAAPAMWR